MNHLRRVLGLLGLCAWVAVWPVHAAEMDNGERIFQASFGVITAFGLKKNLDADPDCKAKTFANFDLNQFLDAIPKDFLTKPNQRQGIEQQFLDYFQKIDEIQLPSGRNIAATYQAMKQSPEVVAYQKSQSTDPSAACKKMYELSGEIFQKQIDSIKLLIVKK